MHTKTLKKSALVLTFWLALYFAPLKAQLLGPYAAGPATFEVDNSGILSAAGHLTTGSLGAVGGGWRMLWYPGKAAFRAGGVSSTQWTDSSIGFYSVAFGWSTIANGPYSSAFGNNSTASGYYSVAFGNHSTASGEGSSAFGLYCSATTHGAFSAGDSCRSSGTDAASFGFLASASGTYSMDTGYFSHADSYCSSAVGTANVGGGDPNNWVSTDPLFEVGNGTVDSDTYTISTPSDAFVVYKNGNAAIQGTLTVGSSATFQGTVNVAPGGDIPMYGGGS